MLFQKINVTHVTAAGQKLTLRLSYVYLYRVAHLVVNLGWVDLNFDYSTVCLILHGLMEVWQNRLGS